MKEQLIREVQRQMLPYLNNAQLKQLQGVLEGALSGVELSRSAGMVDSAKVDTVACFINAKRIEGCSEKTLSYYRQTIVSMLSGIDKEPQEIVTEDLRKYLTEYQANRKSSKVTIDNIRRILSSYFSWLEDEDYIVKSPVRRIHKVKTAKVIKETGRLTDEKIELDEEALTALDMKYQILMDAFDDAPEVTITFFQPDERKAGGKYLTASGAVKKVDDFERRITMQDGAKIPMDDVLSIEGELFSVLE